MPKTLTTTSTILLCSSIFVCASAATRLLAAPPQNPFAGAWAGTFVNLESGAGGTLEWTIAGNGRLTGIYQWDDGASGEFVGTVHSDGALRVAALHGGGAYHGIASFNRNSVMIVRATDVDSGQPFLVELSAS